MDIFQSTNFFGGSKTERSERPRSHRNKVPTPDPGLSNVLCRFTAAHDLIGALCSEDIRSLLCVGCLNRDKEASGGASCQAPLHSVARVDGVATSVRTMSDGNGYSSAVWDGISDQHRKISHKIALTKTYKTLRQPGCRPLP